MRGQVAVSGKQKTFLASLVDGAGSVRAAAKASGVSERQAWRWLQNPDLRDALHSLFNQRLDQAIEFATAQVIPSLRVLVEIRDNPKPGVNAQVRVQAAGKLLDAMRDLRELGDLSEEIALIWEHVRARA